MTLRRLLLLAAASLALIVSVATTPAAMGATVTIVETTEHFVDTVSNPCTGELVTIEGDVTFRSRVTETDNGRFLSGGHTFGTLLGTGLTSGTTYRQIDSRQITTNLMLDADGSLTGTGAWAFLFLSSGGGGNLLLIAHEHVTLTPDGAFEVRHSWSTTRCVG